jgi:hypothetical protein
MKTAILAIVTAVGLSACASHAHAHPHGGSGKWVLNPNKCPDLVEDRLDRLESRIDERYDRNRRDVREDRRDRRESRRDEAVTRCPASAWEWRGPRYVKGRYAPRPTAVAIYYDARGRNYYYGRKNRVVIRF